MSILNFVVIFHVMKIKKRTSPGRRQQMTAFKGQCHILDFIFHKMTADRSVCRFWDTDFSFASMSVGEQLVTSNLSSLQQQCLFPSC